MDAVVDSIVQSSAGEVLTAAQLQALLGIFATTAPSAVMPPTHLLFRKLSATLATCTTRHDAALCVRLCFLLCNAPAHRETVFAVVEASHAQLEALVAPSLAALASSRATGGDGSGIAGTFPSPASDELQFVAQVVLVLVSATEGRLRVVDLVEFLSADLEATVQVLACAYSSVGGTVPGVAALASGAAQLALITHLVELLRELTFWTTYEDLHVRLHISSNAKKALPPSLETVPMATLAGPYRHHLGQLITSLVACNLFNDVCAYLPGVIARCAAPATASDGAASPMSLLRLHLLLLHTLLTHTDQFAVVLRRAVCRAGFLSRVALPLLAQLTRTLSTPAHVSTAGTAVLALLVQTASVAATLSCHLGEAAVFWAGQGGGALVECVRLCCSDATAPAVASTALDGGTRDTRPLAELIAQLVRLVVNARVPAAAPSVLAGWEGLLDEAGRHYVASSLCNPKSRSRAVDITSPAYEALRRVFRLDGRSAPVLPPQRDAQDTGGGGRRRSGSHGRGGGGGGGGGRGRQARGRSDGRGPQSRGRSRQRRRHRGRRGRGRRARMQQRFRLLVQSTAAPAEADRAAAEAQLAALDVAGDSSSSASSRGSSASTSDVDDDGAVGGGVDTSTAVGVPADLTPWRRGAPPPSVPLRYLCALSHAMIRGTPVLSASGYHFDEDVVLDYLQRYSVCPVTGVPMTRADLVVDTALKEELHKVRDNFVL